MPGYFCPYVFFRKPEQWYPTMWVRIEMGGNGVNKRQPIVIISEVA